MLKKKSWKTTIGGLALAIGQGLNAQGESLGTWASPLGQILSILGALFLGFNARDNKVSSEDAGIK